MTDPFARDVLARLESLGALRAQRMFGGVGLYCDERFFGLIAGGELYFKVDDATVESYRAAGSRPFRPFPDRPPMGGYWEVVPSVLDHDARLVEWARRAIEVARRARQRSTAKASRTRGRSRSKSLRPRREHG